MKFYEEVAEDMHYIIAESTDKFIFGSEKLYHIDTIQDRDVLRVQKSILKDHELTQKNQSTITNKFHRIIKFNVNQQSLPSSSINK